MTLAERAGQRARENLEAARETRAETLKTRRRWRIDNPAKQP